MTSAVGATTKDRSGLVGYFILDRDLDGSTVALSVERHVGLAERDLRRRKEEEEKKFNSCWVLSTRCEQ